MTGMITLAGVTKAFGAKQVLQGVDLNIEKGQSVVVIGGSGSGKSVMLKSILGLLTPDAARYMLTEHRRSACRDATARILTPISACCFKMAPV